MKKIALILSLAVIVIAATLQGAAAQAIKGSTRTETFTVKPDGDGYEVQITFTYRFQYCGGQVTLDGYRSKHTALAYWYQGKRYSESEVGEFKTKKGDLYMNLDFSADVYSNASHTRIATGKWSWVNLSNWGGCLGDYGNGETGLKDKDLISLLYLKDIRPKDKPQRDYGIENLLRKRERNKN